MFNSITFAILGDVFDEQDYEKLKGEIHLGDKVITVSAGLIQIGEKLGSGQYGHVYRCCIKGQEHLKLAYKDICLDRSRNKKQVVAQLEVTQKVNQCPDYAVQTYCQITCGINLWLIMELMDLSAHDLLVKSNSRSPKSFIPEPVVRSVSHACVQCLNFLESIDLMHRDVKPSNILLRSVDSSSLNLFICIRVMTSLIADSESAKREHFVTVLNKLHRYYIRGFSRARRDSSSQTHS